MRSVQYGEISVSWEESLDGGGGATFCQDYLPIVRQRFGKVGRVFEFCSGPGFIGFSLLGNGLCDSLCLADVNPEAVKVCQKTIVENGLDDRVRVYLSDCLDTIPTTESWDLVVGNPPHFFGWTGEHRSNKILYDHGWSVHKRFYANVKRFLNSGASVLLVENAAGSTPEVFKPMIEGGGLDLIDVFKSGRTNLELVSIGMFARSRGFPRPKTLVQAAGVIKNPFYFIHSKVRPASRG